MHVCHWNCRADILFKSTLVFWYFFFLVNILLFEEVKPKLDVVGHACSRDWGGKIAISYLVNSKPGWDIEWNSQKKASSSSPPQSLLPSLNLHCSCFSNPGKFQPQSGTGWRFYPGSQLWLFHCLSVHLHSFLCVHLNSNHICALGCLLDGIHDFSWVCSKVQMGVWMSV